jgi:hypothetical protein
MTPRPFLPNKPHPSESFPSMNRKTSSHLPIALSCLGILVLTLPAANRLLGQAAPGGAAAMAGAAGGGAGGGRGGGSGTPGLGAPAINLYQAGVQGSRARGNLSAFTDLEWTAITRMEEQMEKEASAVAKARTALTKAVFAAKPDSADIAAKVQALADAEFVLAQARAAAFPKIKADLKIPQDKLPAFISAVSM